MWLGVKGNRYSLRHTCAEGDKLTRYAWVRHDGATYGRQEIVDQGLAISTSFLKHQDFESGYGGDWAVRVQVAEKPSEREENQLPGRQVSLCFYVADEGEMRCICRWFRPESLQLALRMKLVVGSFISKARSLVCPLSFDVAFLSGTEKNSDGAGGRVTRLSGVELTRKLSEREEMFEKRFQSTFKLQDKV